MQKLVMVRHGERAGMILTDFGRKQITDLTHTLLAEFKGFTCAIATSGVLRAAESAHILAKYFYVEAEVEPALTRSADYCAQSHLEEINDLVQKKGDQIDVLILVGHLPQINRFLAYFTEQVFGKRAEVPKVGYGEAVVVDITGKQVKVVCAS